MFKVAWNEKAYKQLKKIRDKREREMVYDAVGTLANWPACRNVKALTNHESSYRLRIGRYRILFDVRATVQIIEIQEVKKRDEHTY